MTDSKIGVMADGASHDAYVIGTDWALCTTKAEAAERMRGAALGLVVAGDDGQVVTTLDQTFLNDQPGSHRTVLSAAALIAAVERNAVVFHELPGDLVWVAAVREGLPLPGCDRVTSIEAAHELLSEFMSFVPNGTVIGTPVDAARSAETVFRAAGATKRAGCTYRKPKSPAVVLLKIAVAAAAVTGIVVATQSVRVAREAAEHARTATLAKLDASARVDAAVARYTDDVHKALEQARAEIAMSPPVQAQLARWLDALTQQPLVQKGFRLESASCVPSACRFKWRALAHADLSGPAAGAPGSAIEVRDDVSMVIVEPVTPAAKQARATEDRLLVFSRFHQRAGMPNVSFDISPQLSPILAPLPPRPALPPEAQERLSGIQPATIGQQAAVTLAAPLSLVREAAALMGNAVTLKGLETGPLTTTTGGATAPQIKLTGSYVRLP